MPLKFAMQCNDTFFVEESVQKGRDYIMQNKFELLEQPEVSDHRRENEVGTRIFRTRVKIAHPVQAMVSTFSDIGLPLRILALQTLIIIIYGPAHIKFSILCAVH